MRRGRGGRGICMHGVETKDGGGGGKYVCVGGEKRR